MTEHGPPPPPPSRSDTCSSSIDTRIAFSHVQLFVDHVEDLEVYKALECRLNDFTCKLTPSFKTFSLDEKRSLWHKNSSDDSSRAEEVNGFCPQNRDVVKQLLVGLGFRVTASRYDGDTRSVLVTSRDPAGVQIIVTAVAATTQENHYSSSVSGAASVFDSGKASRFLSAHNGRQGAGVLAFVVDNVDAIQDRYQQRHPQLIESLAAVDGGKILEVYACYKQVTSDSSSTNKHHSADPGTTLRFVELSSSSASAAHCLGLVPCDVQFDDTSMAAYCDHWVSNVYDRKEFLDTLHDTLGFTPKVDFNAGVVAAGEAQIESTVTGNSANISSTKTKAEALRDQSQVYLPINNALSSVGHVYGFLHELGQGVQHVANRTENLIDFVQRCNDWREMTGEGFSFLKIPRSYYGMLTLDQLLDGSSGDGGVSKACGEAIMAGLEASLIVSKDGAVDLTAGFDEVARALTDGLSCGPFQDEYEQKRNGVVTTILRSRYRNLWSLLEDTVTEETYLGLVRNQILVDVQGDDVLYQIFTTNILQRNPGEEAPFFEFIQRVCSAGSIRPGCGGFGIRNFLTLFLSIEVGKAMNEVVIAKEEGDSELAQYAQRMVDSFTDQLNEANPILNEISAAMTEEGQCQHEIATYSSGAQQAELEKWVASLAAATERKKLANARLLECSERYNGIMKSMRESRS